MYACATCAELFLGIGEAYDDHCRLARVAILARNERRWRAICMVDRLLNRLGVFRQNHSLIRLGVQNTGVRFQSLEGRGRRRTRGERNEVYPVAPQLLLD